MSPATAPGLAPRPLRLLPALTLIWLLALALALVGLGQLPLRDWDEGIVARVALETSLAPWPAKLLPTYWGDAYLNKPPAIHLLIAACIGLWRAIGQLPPASLPPEWVVRLGPALVSSMLPPLLGLVQLRLWPAQRLAAIASAAIALTLMPLVRHGRLAMLDSSQLVALALLWWALLAAHSGQRPLLLHGALAGLATSLLLLLKAPAALPLVLAALALRWLDRDLGWRCWSLLLLGLALGLLPGLAWHGLHGFVRGPGALLMWTSQGYARVGAAIEGHAGGPGPPLLEVLKGGWPWLPLWPFGLALAWRLRQQRWGRWVLGLSLSAAALVLPLRTQLPWYSLLLWPPFCLACGPVLAWLSQPDGMPRPPAAALAVAIPRAWAALGALLLAAIPPVAAGWLPLPAATLPLLLSLGFGLLVGGLLLLRRAPELRLAAAGLLLAGVALTLALLMAGPLWLWELNESWPVPPVAALLRRIEASQGAKPQLWHEAERPSLNWYAGRRLRALDDDAAAAATAAAGHSPSQLSDRPPAGLPAAGSAGRDVGDGLLLLARQAPELVGLRCTWIDQAGGLGLYHCR